MAGGIYMPDGAGPVLGQVFGLRIDINTGSTVRLAPILIPGAHSTPKLRLVPGGRWLLAGWGGDVLQGENRIGLFALPTGKDGSLGTPQLLVQDAGADFEVSPSGKLLFVSNESLGPDYPNNPHDIEISTRRLSDTGTELTAEQTAAFTFKGCESDACLSDFHLISTTRDDSGDYLWGDNAWSARGETDAILSWMRISEDSASLQSWVEAPETSYPYAGYDPVPQGFFGTSVSDDVYPNVFFNRVKDGKDDHTGWTCNYSNDPVMPPSSFHFKGCAFPNHIANTPKFLFIAGVDSANCGGDSDPPCQRQIWTLPLDPNEYPDIAKALSTGPIDIPDADIVASKSGRMLLLYAGKQLYAWSIDQSTGALNPVPGSPFSFDNNIFAVESTMVQIPN